jgi:hypothetical protein
MRPANRNPLTPASLAADGMQGAEAKAHGRCCAQLSAYAVAALYLAYVTVTTAREQMDAIALISDDPLPGIVEAADLLDAAAERLAQFADAKKGTCGGDE